MAENTGQESASPTDATKTGQEQETETPAVDTAEAIIKAASETGDPAAPIGDDKGEEGKPAPYDQDPKWLAARQAEKNFNAILQEYDIDGADDLKVMLDSGMQLQEILGNRDATKLIQDADTLRRYNEHWAKEARIKEEEQLDPDERADKYKRELEDHKRQTAQEREGAEQTEAAQDAILDFNDRAEGLVDKRGYDEETAEIAKLLVGINNPFNEVDILDGRAVRGMVDGGMDVLEQYVADIKQTAIDDYVAGKSSITPISKTDTPQQPGAVKETKLAPDASPEEEFAHAKNIILEMIDGGQFGT